MTKTRMIYMAVLLIAVAALIWDMQDKSQAPSEKPSNATITKPVNKVVSPATTEPSYDTIELVNFPQESQQNIDTITFQDDVNDIFTASDSFLESGNINKIGLEDPNHLLAQKPLILSAIIYLNKKPAAIINDQIVYIGDTIDDFKIINITPEKVVISKNDITKAISFNFDDTTLSNSQLTQSPVHNLPVVNQPPKAISSSNNLNQLALPDDLVNKIQKQNINLQEMQKQLLKQTEALMVPIKKDN